MGATLLAGIIAGLEPHKLRMRTAATMEAVINARQAVAIFDQRTRPLDVDHRLAREVLAVLLTDEIERLETLRVLLMPECNLETPKEAA